MGIFSRMGDIINANLNAALEKAEDPEKMIRLMIQEMEDTLVEVRSATAKCIAEKKERERLHRRLREQQDDWMAKAELALDKGRDDLARAALTEKTALTDRISYLEEELDQYTTHLARYDEDIAKLQAKLSDARNRQRALVMRHRSASHQVKTRKHLYNDKVDEMLHRFDHAEQRIEQIESEAEALDMGRRGGDLQAEFRELERKEQIDAELAELKSRKKDS